MLDGEIVDRFVVIDTGVAFATVEAAREGAAEFADQAVVGDAEVAEL